MSEKVEIEYALTVSVEDAATQLRQLERLLIRTIGLLQSLGLPPEVDAIIEKIQRLIMIIRQLQIAINIFYASTGPIGWAMAGISVFGAIVSTVDLMEIRSAQY